jgi:hypothetical protein
MDMANGLITFVMGLVTQAMGWVNTLFAVFVPAASDSDGKSKFMKIGIIVVIGYLAAQIFRVKLNVGGGKK